ncbi:MAG: CBS domain-containing protein [Candidatus Omnitrophica bacterium]|nr:CBS domain-containing protein [Candidatus Omnitrophota bacterium]
MLNVVIEDIMSENPITVKESVRVGDVAHLLMRYRINGMLIVKDNDANQIIGIFTTTDLLRLLDQAFMQKTKKMDALDAVSNRTVGQEASHHIVSTQKDTKITKVIAIMHKKNVHTIPVFDQEKLVGIVGRHDILNAAFTN